MLLFELGDSYALTYEYDVGNALVGVKETVNGVAKSTRYVYNKDNVITQMQSPTGTTVNYDYSYDRRTSYWQSSSLNRYTQTLGFPTNLTNITVTDYDRDQTPVPTETAIQIARNGSTASISNDDALRTMVMSDTQRHVLSFWYRAQNGASGTLTGNLRCTNGTAQDTPSVAINTDGKWHYAELTFSPNAPLYTGTGSYVTPSVSWTTTNGSGTLLISGLSFGRETETVVSAARLGNTLTTENATCKTVSDSTAPMAGTVVREWSRSATSAGGWVYLTDVKTATSTPQPGEVWEVTFSAKVTSGSIGNGFYFRFRECDENGDLTQTDASTAVQMTAPANGEAVTVGKWQTYKGYVTVNNDAYETGDMLVPRFGWARSTTAGTVRVNGLTVRKVGDQWCDDTEYMGFAQDTNAQTVLEEVDSVDSPIAYEKTIRAAHTGTMYSYSLSVPRETFWQSSATDTWTLSFWAKTSGTVSLNTMGQSLSLTNGDWRYYSVPLTIDFDTLSPSAMAMYFSISPQSELYLNGANFVPGTSALANDSGQNSAALKNITINTGSTTFNTAIEYDTDANNTAYSRVKHYINNGKAYSYTYDDAGNISKIQSPDGSWVEYTYDSLNQLIREEHSLPLEGKVSPQATDEVSYDTIEYSYDSRGNILSKTYTLTDGTTQTVNYGYTDTAWKDRLTSYNGVIITADEIDNPLNWINGETLTWQHGRQLASFTKNGVTSTYTYDDTGLRTSKTVGGVTTNYYVVDGTLRRLTSGTNTLQFVYGNGLSSVIFNGTEYWYVYNAQGDVIGLINASGSYVVQYTYDSWGKILSQTDSDLARLNPFRYRGYIYDEETGLYYCQSRYYDSEVGRWLNMDGIIVTSSVTSLDINLFIYCANNPINCSDASGYLLTRLENAGGAIGELARCVSKVTQFVRDLGIIKHDVPAYTQGPLDICWASCELMVDSFRKGEVLSDWDSYVQARELAISRLGEVKFEDGGHPLNEGDLIPINMIFLYFNLKNGPLYAVYNNGVDAHMVVVTGMNIWTREVYVNNPNSGYGVKHTVSYGEFLKGYPKNGTLVLMDLYRIYKID